MSKPLTFQCVQAVLKSMDPNKRYEFVQQCPSLKKVDEQTPLYIENLTFDRRKDMDWIETMIVNDVSYITYERRTYIENAEGDEYCMMSTLATVNPNGGKTVKRSTETLKECEDKLFKSFFENKKVFVQHLSTNNYLTSDRLPIDKFHVQNLKIYGTVFRDSRIIFDNMIDPKCLPLKTLEIANTEAEGLLTSDTAERLIVNCSKIDTLSLLSKIKRPDVEFLNLTFRGGPQCRFITNWANETRPIGTCWITRTKDGEQVENVIDALKSRPGVQFDGRSAQLELTEFSAFKFSYEPSETEPMWIMKFEVVPAY